MKAATAVFLREIEERRMFLLAAGLTALLPLTVPLLTSSMRSQAAEVRGAMAWGIALLMGWFFAFSLGRSVIGSELGAGRMGFLFARPISGLAIWVGKMAAAWAVLNYVGDAGYLDIARKKLAAVKKIAAGIDAIDGLRLLAQPQMSLVAFTSDSINVFHIIDEMNARGWYIQPALSFDNSPAHIHLSISASNVGWEDDLLKDLAECVQTAAGLPDGDLVKMVREGLGEVDLANVSEKDIKGLLSLVGIGDQGLPERMADINGVLDELPAAAREKILKSFVNDLFTQ